MASGKTETNKEETIESKEEKQPQAHGGGLTSPEGLLMLPLAATIDAVGFLLPWFGLDDVGLLDIMGMLIIGGWMFLRAGGINPDIVKKGLRRFGVATIVELIPYLGGISPSWVILVYKELK